MSSCNETQRRILQQVHTTWSTAASCGDHFFFEGEGWSSSVVFLCGILSCLSLVREILFHPTRYLLPLASVHCLRISRSESIHRHLRVLSQNPDMSQGFHWAEPTILKVILFHENTLVIISSHKMSKMVK